jgi:acetyltransferase-like isoleucine patch superfamily enzyme
MVFNLNKLKSWVRRREDPVADFIFSTRKSLRKFSIPFVYFVHKPLYEIRALTIWAWGEAWRIHWTTPLFQSRLVRPAPHLHLGGQMPYVGGTLEIEIGTGCTILGRTSMIGRSASPTTPRLRIGRNCFIGYQTFIAVGRTVEIGDDVLISGNLFLAGFPGHPMDPDARAAGGTDTEDQIGDIIIEDGAWLATGVTVVGGVRIGHGSVVAAGSIVTKDVPPGVLVAGVPAKVIKQLCDQATA